MVVYSTQFKVKDTLKIEDFISLVRVWICDPKSKYKFSDFTWDWEEELTLASADSKSSLSIYVLLEQNTVAVKLSTIDDKGIIWDNYYSLVGNEMYVELQKHNQEVNSFLMDTYHLPYLIRLLYANDYISFDVNMELSSGEIKFISTDDNDSIRLAETIISNSKTFDKPVVYITHTDHHEYNFPYAIDIETLKMQLLGIAYTVVEKTSEESKFICVLTNHQNPYKGAIQIYYPNGYTKRIIPCLDNDIPEYRLRNEIVRAILDRCFNAKIEQKFMLSYITSEIHKIQIKNLKENQNELGELQDELGLSRIRISELENEIDQLKSDIYSYQAKCMNLQTRIDNNANTGLLSKGKLDDLYDNEVFDCIYDILKDTYDTTNPESRQYEILKEILNTNRSRYTNSRKSKIEQFRQNAYNAKGSTKRFKTNLEDMGLVVYGEKHTKVKFPNGKQIATLGSTPSDHRDADNATTEFKKLF